MNNSQWRFIHDQILLSSVMAALQRASVYTEGASQSRKQELRDELEKQLVNLGGQYSQEVPEAKHIGNIRELSQAISSQYGDILIGGKFRIGLAQKALNLYLKYLWCLDKIQRPPHCPFDRGIIEQLGLPEVIPWTRMDDIKDYKVLVEAAKKKAGDTPLAEWELKVYQGAQRDDELWLA